MQEALFEHCPEVFIVAGPDALVAAANREAARVLGASCGRGASLASAVHPDDRPAFVKQWARLAEGAAPSRTVARFRGDDGAFRPFSWSARGVPERGEVYVVLVPAPAPEEAKPAPAPAEPRADLRVSAAQILRTILDTLDIAVNVINPDGTVTFHDGKGIRASGVEPGDYLGKDIFELYGGFPDIVANLKRSLTEAPVHYVVEAHAVLWENWFTPVRDERGNILCSVGVTLDKSESKRQMQELEQRLALIERQQEVIRNLETPIIEIWDRVITLPMVGMVDSRRAACVMDDLLNAVVRRSARYAILDLTGVDTVDTATASHLIGLVRAIRLLGAEGIITGIRPTVAQTIVTLGLDLSAVSTCGSLRDGLKLAIRRLGAESETRAS